VADVEIKVTIIDLKTDKLALLDNPQCFGNGHIQGMETDGDFYPGDGDMMHWLPGKTWLKAGDLRLELRNQVFHSRGDRTVLVAYLFADDAGILFGALFESTMNMNGAIAVPRHDRRGVVCEVWGIFSNLQTFMAWLRQREAARG
jgi:hypothetical protein